MFSNSGYYFIVLLFLAIVGFWQSYFSKLFGDVGSYTHLHAVTMLLWIGMLISQAFLIRLKKWPAHKFIGKFSYGLVPVLVISLVLLAHNQIEIGENGIYPSRRYILFLQLSLLAIFIMAYVLAITYRHAPAIHARYMICTALTLIDPAVARIPINIPPLPFPYQIVTFGITDLILLLLIVMERNQTQGRKVFPFMLMVFVLFQSLNLTQTDASAWKIFAMWFANLPLT